MLYGLDNTLTPRRQMVEAEEAARRRGALVERGPCASVAPFCRRATFFVFCV
jgi:hypothetical protein